MENPTTQKDSSKMNTVSRAGLFILLFGLGLLFWSVPAHSESAVVVRVIDGDTITVQIAGAIRTIRLIGVDTPETVPPTKKVQPGGPEASAFAKAALDRQTVRLEADPARLSLHRSGRMPIDPAFPSSPPQTAPNVPPAASHVAMAASTAPDPDRRLESAS